MKYLSWITPVVLSSALLLPGCDKEPEDRAPRSETGPGAAATQMPVGDLESAIRAKLESDDATRQANLSVAVDVQSNKVTLSGQVVSEDIRDKAIELAKSAQSGLTIEDKIDVKPAV